MKILKNGSAYLQKGDVSLEMEEFATLFRVKLESGKLFELTLFSTMVPRLRIVEKSYTIPSEIWYNCVSDETYELLKDKKL